MAASLMEGSCGRRVTSARSPTRSTVRATNVVTSNQTGTSIQQASGNWQSSVPEVSPAAEPAGRPTAPEVMGPRDDDTAAGDTPLHVPVPSGHVPTVGTARSNVQGAHRVPRRGPEEVGSMR